MRRLGIRTTVARYAPPYPTAITRASAPGAPCHSTTDDMLCGCVDLQEWPCWYRWPLDWQLAPQAAPQPHPQRRWYVRTATTSAVTTCDRTHLSEVPTPSTGTGSLEHFPPTALRSPSDARLETPSPSTTTQRRLQGLTPLASTWNGGSTVMMGTRSWLPTSRCRKSRLTTLASCQRADTAKASHHRPSGVVSDPRPPICETLITWTIRRLQRRNTWATGVGQILIGGIRLGTTRRRSSKRH